MESKQFIRDSIISRYIVYVLVGFNLLVLIIGVCILFFSKNPFRSPLLLVIIFSLFITLFGFAILSFFYNKQIAVKEKRHLLYTQKKLNSEISRISKDVDYHTNRRAHLHQEKEAALSSRKSEFSQKIQHLNNRRNQISLSESNEIASTLSHLQNSYINQGLRLALIKDANISGIGPKFKERLIKNGITSAAQVSSERLSPIPGFGEAKVSSVVAWRRQVEYSLTATKPTQLPQEVESKIRSKHTQEQLQVNEEEKIAKAELETDLITIQQRFDHMIADNEQARLLAIQKLTKHKENAVNLGQQVRLYEKITPVSYLHHILNINSSLSSRVLFGAYTAVLVLLPLSFILLGTGTTFSLIVASIPTHTSTPTVTPTFTATQTHTPTFTVTPSKTPTKTLTPTPSNTPTITPTPTITSIPTQTHTPSETPKSSPTLPSNAESCIPRNTLRQVGYVVGITDGDTIVVSLEDGNNYNVRYIGMDTPEQGDTGYGPASTRNTELVDGKNVTLVRDVSETDQYNRLLRYVIVGNTFVNYELVKSGLATAFRYPPDVSCATVYSEAENYARTNQLGLWAPALPSLPTDTPSFGGGNCDPAYPTVCIPSPPPDLDCKDIPYRRFKVLPPDPHNFDGDHDGIGCESG